MNRMTLAAVTVLLSSPLAAAPLIDIYAGAYTGRLDSSGLLGKENGTQHADLQRDLGYDDTRQRVFYIGLEHPVPVLPNVRLKQSKLSESAAGTLTQSFEFGGEVFAASTPVTSRYTLDATDLTLYYTPIDLGVKLDVGLTVRQLDAEFEVAGAGNTAREKADVVLPLVHLGAFGKLPFTGFYASGEVNGLAFDGNSLVDARAGIGWMSDFLLGVELGYSHQALDIEADDIKADLEFGGPYVSLRLSF